MGTTEGKEVAGHIEGSGRGQVRGGGEAEERDVYE